MKRYEYKIVNMSRGISVGFSKSDHDKKIMGILTEMGDEGWELKTLSIWSAYSRLIFSREKN